MDVDRGTAWKVYCWVSGGCSRLGQLQKQNLVFSRRCYERRNYWRAGRWCLIVDAQIVDSGLQQLHHRPALQHSFIQRMDRLPRPFDVVSDLRQQVGGHATVPARRMGQSGSSLWSRDYDCLVLTAAEKSCKWWRSGVAIWWRSPEQMMSRNPPNHCTSL